jgi:hypothetical protein
MRWDTILCPGWHTLFFRLLNSLTADKLSLCYKVSLLCLPSRKHSNTRHGTPMLILSGVEKVFSACYKRSPAGDYT